MEQQIKTRIMGRSLGGNALIVAVITTGVDWSAYIGAGYESDVARSGDKAPKEIAKYYFPEVKEPWRY